MVEIALSESDWDDLNSITDYIALDSPRYAQEFSDRILERIQQLASYPESGKTVREFKNEFLRELTLDSYRIIYRVYEPAKIVVLRIIHGAKLLK